MAETFGRFLLEERIGRGGMGEVYRAYDPQQRRQVAVKRLWSQGLDEDERSLLARRLAQEADTMSGLAIPNVLPVFESGRIDGQPYIVMPYVQGRDLAQVVQGGPLAARRTVSVIGQLATALDFTHAAGLVHRDVKPSNVLLVEHPGGRDAVYLLDYGIARALSDVTGTGLTRGVIGTFAYIAPERLDGEEASTDGRVDVYALACIFFECLTGQRPYPALSEAALLWAHVRAPIPLPSSTNPALAAFDPIVRRGLAKRPDERFGTAGELAAAAEDALGTAGRAPDGVELPPTADRPPTHSWDGTAPAARRQRSSGRSAGDVAQRLNGAAGSTAGASARGGDRPNGVDAAVAARAASTWMAQHRRVIVLSGVALASVTTLIGVMSGPLAVDFEPTGSPPATEQTTSTAGPMGSSAPPSDQIRWADLEPFTPTGPTLYEQSFADPAPAWPTGTSDTYELALQDAIYRLHPLAKNEAVTVTAPAPVNTHQSDLVVSATAALSSGQGIWGVWCRGVDSTPSDAYYFEISHTAAVRILVSDGSQFGSGTGWFYLDGVDISQLTTISARCDDVPGAPIELTMAVNGRTALRYWVANQDSLLGPGFSGVSAQTFGDVEGPTAEIRVSEVHLQKFQ